MADQLPAPRTTTLAIIGGGPRAIGLLERINANQPLLAPGLPLQVVIFDPHPAGPGRIWRYDQSPSLKMNSLAEDVAMFTDDSCQIEGPLVPGPTLAEWFELVRAGEIAFTPPDPVVAEELAQIGPQGFATRRLLSCYLRWYFERVRDEAPAEIRVTEINARVERVNDDGDAQRLIYHDAAGILQELIADAVIYSLGHTDAQPTEEEVERHGLADVHGLHYWHSHYSGEADFSAIPAGEAVLIRGLGLSFIDVVVRLTLDRGGRFTINPGAPAGERYTYHPGGNEPRIFAGSGRGVPYHSKITSHYHGEKPGMVTSFVTKAFLSELLESKSDVDFIQDVWPTITKEMAYWAYREILTGHPERGLGSWEELSSAFFELEWGSPELDAAIARAIRPEDRFDIQAFDRPLDNKRFASLAAVQPALTEYIKRDLYLRESEEHSETLAIFWAILSAYVVIGEFGGHASWSADSKTRQIPRIWHDFFSYVDSGPPAERLELLTALQREGLLTFTGGGARFEIDDDRGLCVATSAQHDETVSGRYWIDAFHPRRAIETSAEPVLLDLVATGQGQELILQDRTGPIATGKLAIDRVSQQLVRSDGTLHPRRFGVGDFTSAPAAGTFARPGTNARIFRENDAIARSLLTFLSDEYARVTEASVIGTR